MIGPAPLCLSCRFFHNNATTLSCDAFPDGIPDPIIDTSFVHTQPYPGDNGIQYEKKAADKKVLKFKQYTTAMIGFNLEDDAFGKKVDGGDAHITLLFLGEISELEDKIDEISAALKKFADSHAPLDGKFNGFAVFPSSPENDNKAPVVALLDSPQLPAFRQALLHAIAEIIPSVLDQTHGFTAHMTMSYTTKDNVELPTADVKYSKTFDSMTLFWGDSKTEFKLVGNIVEKSKKVLKLKSFPDHLGRPGEQGGSLPRNDGYNAYNSLNDLLNSEFARNSSMLGFYVVTSEQIIVAMPNPTMGGHEDLAKALSTSSKYGHLIDKDYANKYNYEMAAYAKGDLIRCEYSKKDGMFYVQTIPFGTKQLHAIQAILNGSVNIGTVLIDGYRTAESIFDPKYNIVHNIEFPFNDFMTSNKVYIHDNTIILKEQSKLKGILAKHHPITSPEPPRTPTTNAVPKNVKVAVGRLKSFPGHKGIPGHQGGSLPENDKADMLDALKRIGIDVNEDIDGTIWYYGDPTKDLRNVIKDYDYALELYMPSGNKADDKNAEWIIIPKNKSSDASIENAFKTVVDKWGDKNGFMSIPLHRNDYLDLLPKEVADVLLTLPKHEYQVADIGDYHYEIRKVDQLITLKIWKKS